MVWPGDISHQISEARHVLDGALAAYKRWVWSPNQDLLASNLTEITLDPPAHLSFVYVVEITSGDPAVVLERMRDAKQQHLLPKIHKNTVPTTILYVGSSGKNLRGRLLQHVVPEPVGTWALKINTWCSHVPDFEARFHVRGFAHLGRAERYAMEDAIAEQLLPMVGKRGGNNK